MAGGGPSNWAFTAGLGLLGSAALVAALYLLILAVAAFGYKERRADSNPASRLTVLVPAHDEHDLVERCIESLKEQDYQRNGYEVVVIADNCTDDTADLARKAGARVLVRTNPELRGKGFALRWGMDLLLAEGATLDAFVIVDADSVADAGLLRALATEMESGADAVQACYQVLDDTRSPSAQLRAVAFLLFHRVRFAGRAALGLPCNLVGNGMLLSRRLVEQHPWDAFTGAEDLEYSIRLRLRDVRPAFARSALVWGPVPDSARASQVQRERWEGGRLLVVRTSMPELLSDVLLRRRLGLIDVILDLLVPPLGLLSAGAILGLVAAVASWAGGFTTLWLLVPWATSIAAITAFVLLGLRAAHAPKWMYRRLASAPGFLLRKVVGTLGTLRSRPADQWIRTERPSEVAS